MRLGTRASFLCSSSLVTHAFRRLSGVCCLLRPRYRAVPDFARMVRSLLAFKAGGGTDVLHLRYRNLPACETLEQSLAATCCPFLFVRRVSFPTSLNTAPLSSPFASSPDSDLLCLPFFLFFVARDGRCRAAEDFVRPRLSLSFFALHASLTMPLLRLLPQTENIIVNDVTATATWRRRTRRRGCDEERLDEERLTYSSPQPPLARCPPSFMLAPSLRCSAVASADLVPSMPSFGFSP